MMLRADIRIVDYGKALAGEAGYRRPALIVSANGANAAVGRSRRGAVTVVALTSNTHALHSFEVLLPSEETGLPQASKAQVHLIRAVSVSRVGPRIGTVPPRLMKEIDEALRTHLSL